MLMLTAMFARLPRKVHGRAVRPLLQEEIELAACRIDTHDLHGDGVPNGYDRPAPLGHHATLPRNLDPPIAARGAEVLPCNLAIDKEPIE